MTGLFTRLAARATGEAGGTSVAAPRLPARFEPTGDATGGPQGHVGAVGGERFDRDGEDRAGRETGVDEGPSAWRDDRSPGTTDPASTAPSGATHGEREPPPAPAPAVGTVTGAAGPVAPPRRSATTTDQRATVPAVPAAGNADADRTSPLRRRSTDGAPPQDHRPGGGTAAAADEALVRVVAVPAQTGGVAAPAIPGQADAAAPSAPSAGGTAVTIHIGRVEVRAGTPRQPPTPAPRSRPTAPEPAGLDLRAYLDGDRGRP